MKLDFFQVDVFTSVPFRGNPVAVVLDADILTDGQMQQIANWTNLSETAFVQSSDHCDYKLRIFSTQTEFKFAGHPTLGSLYAMIKSGRLDCRQNEFTQESKIGPIKLQKIEDVWFVRMPPATPTGFLISRTDLGNIAGCRINSDPVAFDIGPTWLTASVSDKLVLFNINLKLPEAISLCKRNSISGFTFYCFDKNGSVHVRTFAPALGVTEDPVCGSGISAVAEHLRITGKPKHSDRNTFTAFQGSALGRDGRVQVRYRDNDIYIGGNSEMVIEGIISC